MCLLPADFLSQLTSLAMLRITLCDTLANTTLRISPQKAAPALLQQQ